MQVNEIFDTELDLQWLQQGRFELASFSVKGVEYVVQIEQKPISLTKVPELKGKKTAEISFYTREGGEEESHSTTYNIGHAAPAVYGIILNALTDKFKEYDAFYFDALVRHSKSEDELNKKMHIYLTLANSLQKRTPNARVYDQRSKYQHAFLVSKIPIDNNDFVNEAIEYIKTTDWSEVPKV